MDQDTGTDIFVLVRVLPIDLFGLTLIFFIVSSMFSQCPCPGLCPAGASAEGSEPELRMSNFAQSQAPAQR
jgi:hypothetical protein